MADIYFSVTLIYKAIFFNVPLWICIPNVATLCNYMRVRKCVLLVCFHLLI